MDDILDCVVVGGGPAGLTAGIYLGRYLRNFRIIDGGDSRAHWIPVSHNHPGYPEGVEGDVLLDRMREQARRYGAVIETGCVDRVTREGDLFALSVQGRELRARTVLLATGVTDVEPAIGDVFAAVKHTLIRICPICDAYEVEGQRVGVIGAGDKVVREAAFLKTYTDDLTVILIGEGATLSAEERARLKVMDVALCETSAEKVRIEDDRILAFDDASGRRRTFDTVYSAMGTIPQGRLAAELGAMVDPGGCLEVDDHQETTVDGLFAAGDLVRGLNQINVAMGEAAIAATAIHNRLRGL